MHAPEALEAPTVAARQALERHRQLQQRVARVAVRFQPLPVMAAQRALPAARQQEPGPRFSAQQLQAPGQAPEPEPEPEL